MQRKKYFHHLIGILFCCVTFSSCLDDNEPETVYPTLGTVNADGKDIIIESDSYGPLVPVNPGFITSTRQILPVKELWPYSSTLEKQPRKRQTALLSN